MAMKGMSMSNDKKRPVWFVAAAFAPFFAATPVFLPAALETSRDFAQAGPLSRFEVVLAQTDGTAFWQAAASAADAEARVESLLEHLSDQAGQLGADGAIGDLETLKLKDSLSRMLEANRQQCPQKEKGSRTS